jgi:hypothetical protein
MLHFAAAATLRRGALLGGAEGRALVLEAEGRFRDLGIRNPARMAEMLAPGMGAARGGREARGEPGGRDAADGGSAGAERSEAGVSS